MIGFNTIQFVAVITLCTLIPAMQAAVRSKSETIVNSMTAVNALGRRYSPIRQTAQQMKSVQVSAATCRILWHYVLC